MGEGDEFQLLPGELNDRRGDIRRFLDDAGLGLSGLNQDKVRVLPSKRSTLRMGPGLRSRRAAEIEKDKWKQPKEGRPSKDASDRLTEAMKRLFRRRDLPSR
jgi:hypothetical protein